MDKNKHKSGKKDKPIASPDAQKKTGREPASELTDEELNKASGGTGQRMHKPTNF